MRAWIIPTITFTLLVVTFICSYTIAVVDDHVLAVLPYISDTGTLAPESCIFGQLLNLSAIFMGLCVYIRHQEVSEYHFYVRHRRRHWLNFNTIFLGIGTLAAVGASMVANFQESRWSTIHYVGAAMAFGLGNIYCWAQTVITYFLRPIYTGRPIAHLRLFLSMLGTGFLISTEACGFYITPSYLPEVGYLNVTVSFLNIYQSATLHHLYPGDKNYYWHLCSTGSEWLLAFSFLFYFLTFVVEMKQARLKPPKLVLNISDLEYPLEHARNTIIETREAVTIL